MLLLGGLRLLLTCRASRLSRVRLGLWLLLCRWRLGLATGLRGLLLLLLLLY